MTLGKVSANIEGWALYSERLMDELGFLTDPARRLGFLDEQMLRTIRVIIDIGMHLGLTVPADSGFHPGERWTPALATEFLATYNGSPAEMHASEIDRYLGWPGQAIGYKLGERVWLQGREAARRRQGAGVRPEVLAHEGAVAGLPRPGRPGRQPRGVVTGVVTGAGVGAQLTV